MSIASLITDLIAAGTPAELVGRVAAALAEREVVTVQVKDEAAERRRAADRERKANVRRLPQTSADSADTPSPPEMVPPVPFPDPIPNPPLNPPTPLVRPKRVRTQYRDDFEDFWSAYPTDPLMSKKDTAAAWDRLDPEDRAKARQAVRPFAEHCAKTPDYRPVHAVRFLTQRRFDGFVQLHAPPPGTPHFETQEEFDAWWANRKATA